MGAGRRRRIQLRSKRGPSKRHKASRRAMADDEEIAEFEPVQQPPPFIAEVLGS